MGLVIAPCQHDQGLSSYLARSVSRSAVFEGPGSVHFYGGGHNINKIISASNVMKTYDNLILES